MFNDLPSSRRGHLLVVSFIFFLFFFCIHSFFFANFIWGKFFLFLNFGVICACVPFLYFFCKNPCEIFFFLFFFFLGGLI